MITLSEVRTQVNSTPDSDAVLDLLRQGVISRWERETNIRWVKVEGSEWTTRPDRPDRQVIYLPLMRVDAETLAVEVRRHPDDVFEALDGDDFELLRADEWTRGAAPELVRLCGYWPARVKVTMTGGFDADDCPPEIKRALLLQVHFEWQRWQESALSMRSRSVGQSSADYLEGDLHPVFDTLARRYAAGMVG